MKRTRFESVKIVVLGLLLCCASQATINQVQQVTGSASSGGSLCPTTGTTCAATVAPTGSGNILVAVFALIGSGASVSAVSGGGTWIHAPNCAAAAGANNVDCWYVLSSTAGATTITGTVTNGSGRGLFFYEFSVGSGCSAAYDSSNSSDDGSSASSQPGIALTLSGFNDVIVQGVDTGPNISSIGGGYNMAANASNRSAAALLNTISGAAPAWGLTSGQIAAVDAIAISETCPVSIALNPQQTTLFALQMQQFTANVVGNTQAVTWSLNPQVGSISAAGLYTAPATISSAQTVSVTATSVNVPSKSASAAVSLMPGAVLATFQLSELFGVTWPNQTIEFRYDGGQPPAGTTRMMGPSGTEVPYQWVSSCSDATATKGCIAVQSNLPEDSAYTWSLQSGTPPSATPVNPVQLQQGNQYWTISNGLAGIQLIAPAANPAPYNLAPIQGIQMPNSSGWTGVGASPNLLYAEPAGRPGCIGCVLETPMFDATGYTLTAVDNGPMKVVVNATYTFNRPQYTAGNTVINTAGQGHYTLIVTMYANSKSILIDEDSDMQFSYYLPVYAQLQPDTARWRGHNSVSNTGNNDPACGYETPLTVTAASNATPIVITTSASGNLSSGQVVLLAGVQGNTAANGTYFAATTGYSATQFALYHDAALTQPVSGNGAWTSGGVVKPAYRGQSLTPTPDAFVDLTYTVDRPASYLCSTGGTNSWRKLLSDYPAAAPGAPWYVEFYNSTAGAAAPIIGFYTGRASKQVFSATGPSMPGMYTSNKHFITGAQAAGIQVDNLLRGPDGSTTALVHRNWAIFVSTQADLLAPSLHQPIGDQENELTGINLSRLYTYQLVYPDPAGGWQWLYLSPAGAAQLQNEVQNGTSVCGSQLCYANLLEGSEGSAAGLGLVSMWQGNSTAAVQNALNSSIGLAHFIENVLVSGDNHLDDNIGYYQLGLNTSPQTAVLNAILMNANTTPAQAMMAKACLALFGSLFWDDDWFPIENNSGESVGLANQIQQYLEYRAQAVAAAPSQPYLAAMVSTAITYPANDFTQYFSATGAASGSTHYQSAFFEPLILNYLNFSLDGTTAINGYQPPISDPKWAAYANWELSIQTPPEPRFGGSTNPLLGLPMRKGYSNGDGNTEADVRTGMLGTALSSVNPAVSGNLMWAWQASNSNTVLTEDAQFVTTLAVIDPSIPAVEPTLASINIPGYHSVERFNFGTADETALWFINGGFYSSQGHRHFDDGQVSIYAHAAPLAIDWNANLYYPSTSGRFMHNSIVYDSEMGQLWSADQPGLQNASELMNNPTNTEFGSFSYSTTSTATFSYPADGTVWMRTVRMMNFNSSYPIIYVTDSFAGASAGTGKTLTWNMMATGSVSTPAGPVTPTARFSAGCQSPAGALPSNGTVSSLANGLNAFNFTGFPWPKHAAGGIDWDLFILASDATQQFMIGNWGHGCQSGREMNEYLAANGAPFAEVQDILRVHDTGPFSTIIMPYQKTQVPTRTITQQACGVQVKQGDETTCFNASAATYTKPGEHIFTVYDSSTQTSPEGFVVSGGPQEVALQGDLITWTINGVESTTRSLTLPGTWYSDAAGVTNHGNTYNYSAYAGGPQAAPVAIHFSQVPWPIHRREPLDRASATQPDEESQPR